MRFDNISNIKQPNVTIVMETMEIVGSEVYTY